MFKVGRRGIVFVGNVRAFRKALKELRLYGSMTLLEYCRSRA